MGEEGGGGGGGGVCVRKVAGSRDIRVEEGVVEVQG